MAADRNTGVVSAMVGKNWNTTLLFTRRLSVEFPKEANVAKLTVPTTMLRVKRGRLCRITASTTSCFLVIGALHTIRSVCTNENHCSDSLLM